MSIFLNYLNRKEAYLVFERLKENDPIKFEVKSGSINTLEKIKSKKEFLIIGVLCFVFILTIGLGKIIYLFGLISIFVLYKARVKQQQINKENDILIADMPLDIEQLLMIIQSGLDIIPAIAIIDKTKSSQKVSTLIQKSNKNADIYNERTSIIAILKSTIIIAESGELFEKVLINKAATQECVPLRYALYHIAHSYVEGGEIKTALSELANSTQQSYEENINKIISTLPAKAILPLVITFSGLLICFLTSPILQVLKLTAKSTIGGAGL